MGARTGSIRQGVRGRAAPTLAEPVPMSADITPEEARKATDELLTQLANMYRPGSGAHTVVINEINARAEHKKLVRRFLYVLAVAVVGLIATALKFFLF